MRTRFVVGNWKLNGGLAANQGLLQTLAASSAKPGAQLAVCAPFPYLAQAQSILAGTAVGWGAQDASAHDEGAYTGEVSARMIAEFGAGLVIVGHSERRALFGDTDAVVARKFERSLAAGLVPILCVGESLSERDQGATLDVVSRQLGAVLDAVGVENLGRGIVAYEPVWAIGTGRTATASQAQEVHAHLRQLVAQRDSVVAGKLSILYGGSVKKANAAELFGQADIDGGLVGGASLVADEFLGIWGALA